MMTASGLQQMVLLACSLTYRRLHSSSLRIPCRTARLEVRSEPGAIWDDLIHGREHFCLERYSGRLRLRPGHPYYYQLIALMGILDLPWVDICIMKNEEIYIERLINDENVWFTVKEKLKCVFTSINSNNVISCQIIFYFSFLERLTKEVQLAII
ncbi:unnamed protein product [Rotaria magnacalcarata]